MPPVNLPVSAWLHFSPLSFLSILTSRSPMGASDDAESRKAMLNVDVSCFVTLGLLSWDCSECHVDLERELQAIVASKPEGEEVRFGERLVQFATENLVTEILVHPQLNTLQQCMRNLLSSFTKHRHIIHAGYTFKGNGSWILQDGTISLSDMVEALHEPEVIRVLRAYEGTVSVFMHCAQKGKWSTQRFQSEPVSKLCRVLVNPPAVIPDSSPHVLAFLDYVSDFLIPTSLASLLQPTEVVGNIRFTHPTLYVFPGGQGDAALFGINGFNMLVDGGFARKSCFWDFARHLDRLDAVLLTRLNNSTVQGIAAVLRRKKMNHVYPQIGHFFCNLQDRKISLSPESSSKEDSLIVDLAEEGREIVSNLRHLALKPHPCYRDGHQVDPVNLYHKVGHGKLDMYVISPARDSKVVKEFLAKWQDEDSDLFASASRKMGGRGFDFPLQNLVSICALLVWQPANPEDTITRILFPGSTPQDKVFEGLEKLRHLEFLKHPVCSARTVSPSASSAPLVKKILSKKSATNTTTSTSTTAPKPKLMKPKAAVPKEVKAKPDTKVDTNKLIEESKETPPSLRQAEKLENIENELKKMEKESSVEKIISEIDKIDKIEADVKKITHKSKYDMKNVRSKVDSRAPSKSIDRKKDEEKKTDASPPVTPKKAAVKPDKPRQVRPRISPTSTPAKSAKEANNRKVVEARAVTKTTQPKTTTPRPAKKEEAPPVATATEKKPITRRPKAATTASKTVSKIESTSVPRKVTRKLPIDLIEKASTDSTVSTPSGAETIAKPKAVERRVKRAQEAKTEVAEKDGKEDSKPVEIVETEAKAVSDVDLCVVEKEKLEIKLSQESNKSADGEEEEYLIVTKEEEADDSIKVEEELKDNESCLEETKDETEGEGEIKKLQRDEQDSEKRRKMQEANMEVENQEEDAVAEPEDVKAEEQEKKAESSGSPSDKKDPLVKSDGPKLGDTEEVGDAKEGGSKEQTQPDEKFSTTLETSATTAPTLPEDERVPLEGLKEEEKLDDETKEVEEKYIKEETKESAEKKQEKPEQPTSFAPIRLDQDVGAQFVIKTKTSQKDLVKTPDEVADLPVHEEVDPTMYASNEYTKDLQIKDEGLDGGQLSADVLLKENEDGDAEEKVLQPEQVPVEVSDVAIEDKNVPDNQLDLDDAEKVPETLDEAENEENTEIVQKENLATNETTVESPDGVKKIPIESADVISLVAIPPSQLSANETPIGSPAVLSPGKQTPEVQTAVTSGKASPCVDEEQNMQAPIENITQENEIAGEVPEETDKEEKGDVGLSGGASPSALASGKQSPELETADLPQKLSALPEVADNAASNKTEVHGEKDSDKTDNDAILGSLPPLAEGSLPVRVEKDIIATSPGTKTPAPSPSISGKITPELDPSADITEKLDDIAQSTVPSGQEQISSANTSPRASVPDIGTETTASAEQPGTTDENTRNLSSAAETEDKPDVTSGKASQLQEPEIENKSNAPSGITSPVPESKSSDPLEKVSSAQELEIESNSGAPSGKTSPIPEVEIKSGATSGKVSPTKGDEIDTRSGAPSGKTSPIPEVGIKSGATSGKVSPIQEPETGLKSGSISEKVSPTKELEIETKSGAPSGKTSPIPEIEINSGAASGKVSPTQEPEVGGKSTATSGKVSPTIDTEIVTKSGAPSGKTSPIPEVEIKSGATSGKVSPTQELEVGGKSTATSGKVSPTLENEIVTKSGAPSGKTSPIQEVEIKSGATSGKVSPTQELEVGGKSTATSGKVSPTLDTEIVTKSGAPSGKTSPIPEGEIKSGATSGKVSPTQELEVGGKSTATSGKASPTLENEIVTKSGAPSGKTSPIPEVEIKSADTSGIVSPIQEPEIKGTPSVASGTATPTQESDVGGKSGTTSGKVSPVREADLGTKSDATSGKVSPTKELEVESKSGGTSGKVTPIKEIGNKSETPSGKSTPVQETMVGVTSGKVSPTEELEVEIEYSATSGKVSPTQEVDIGNKSGTPSVKATPVQETVVERMSGTTSGKVSPTQELEVESKSGAPSGKTSPLPDPKAESQSGATSGKISPTQDLEIEIKSGATSGKVSPVPERESGASPGKITPTQETETEIKSGVTSGKVSPVAEPKLEMGSGVSSGKVSPVLETKTEIRSVTSSGKASPTKDLEIETSPVQETLVESKSGTTSGKISPTQESEIGGRSDPTPTPEMNAIGMPEPEETNIEAAKILDSTTASRKGSAEMTVNSEQAVKSSDDVVKETSASANLDKSGMKDIETKESAPSSPGKISPESENVKLSVFPGKASPDLEPEQKAIPGQVQEGRESIHNISISPSPTIEVESSPKGRASPELESALLRKLSSETAVTSSPAPSPGNVSPEHQIAMATVEKTRVKSSVASSPEPPEPKDKTSVKSSVASSPGRLSPEQPEPKEKTSVKSSVASTPGRLSPEQPEPKDNTSVKSSVASSPGRLSPEQPDLKEKTSVKSSVASTPGHLSPEPRISAVNSGKTSPVSHELSEPSVKVGPNIATTVLDTHTKISEPESKESAEKVSKEISETKLSPLGASCENVATSSPAASPAHPSPEHRITHSASEKDVKSTVGPDMSIAAAVEKQIDVSTLSKIEAENIALPGQANEDINSASPSPGKQTPEPPTPGKTSPSTQEVPEVVDSPRDARSPVPSPLKEDRDAANLEISLQDKDSEVKSSASSPGKRSPELKSAPESGKSVAHDDAAADSKDIKGNKSPISVKSGKASPELLDNLVSDEASNISPTDQLPSNESTSSSRKASSSEIALGEKNLDAQSTLSSPKATPVASSKVSPSASGKVSPALSTHELTLTSEEKIAVSTSASGKETPEHTDVLAVDETIKTHSSESSRKHSLKSDIATDEKVGVIDLTVGVCLNEVQKTVQSSDKPHQDEVDLKTPDQTHAEKNSAETDESVESQIVTKQDIEQDNLSVKSTAPTPDIMSGNVSHASSRKSSTGLATDPKPDTETEKPCTPSKDKVILDNAPCETEKSSGDLSPKNETDKIAEIQNERDDAKNGLTASQTTCEVISNQLDKSLTSAINGGSSVKASSELEESSIISAVKEVVNGTSNGDANGNAIVDAQIENEDLKSKSPVQDLDRRLSNGSSSGKSTPLPVIKNGAAFASSVETNIIAKASDDESSLVSEPASLSHVKISLSAKSSYGLEEQASGSVTSTPERKRDVMSDDEMSVIKRDDRINGNGVEKGTLEAKEKEKCDSPPEPKSSMTMQENNREETARQSPDVGLIASITEKTQKDDLNKGVASAEVGDPDTKKLNGDALKTTVIERAVEVRIENNSIQSGSGVVEKIRKDDINEQVKKYEDTTTVKRMLVTATSEDGGEQTELCQEVGTSQGASGNAAEEEEDDGGDFSCLIQQAKAEYDRQRSRKSSYNSSDEGSIEEKEVRTKTVQLKISKTTSTSTSTTTDKEGNRISVKTITTTEKAEQLDGSIKVTTTIEKITSNGQSEDRKVEVSETILQPLKIEDDIDTEDILSPVSVTSQAPGFDFEEYTRAKVEEFAKVKTGEVVSQITHSDASKKQDASQSTNKDDSRRTSASSVISHEDLVSRLDSRLEEFKGSSSSVELSPLKTTYITSQSGAESEALMTSSFYGCLPDEGTEPLPDKASSSLQMGFPEPISEVSESQPESPEERLDFAKAMDEHRSARGEDLGPTNQQPKPDDKDPIAGWGKPLGLPSPPKNAYKPYFPMGQNISTTSSLSTPSDNSDGLTNWGQPMSLPQPAVPPTAESGEPAEPAAAPLEPKQTPTKKVAPQKKPTETKGTTPRRTESPVRPAEKKVAPLYVELTYVPHNGNSYYSNVEFFKRVRARYYVFSGTEPSKEVYNALLEAKQSWEDKDLEVTIIPTYDTDVLGYWVAENEEALAKHKIDLSPSASRCTINLQDHETSCSAYRLEF